MRWWSGWYPDEVHFWIYNEIKARSRDKAPSLVQDDQSDVRGRPPRKNGMSNGVAQFIRGIIIINKTINKAVRFISFSWSDSSRPIHWHAHTTTTISISNNPTNTNTTNINPTTTKPTTTTKWQGCRTRWWRSKGSTTVIIATKRSRRRGGPASSRASPKGEDDEIFDVTSYYCSETNHPGPHQIPSSGPTKWSRLINMRTISGIRKHTILKE